MLCTIVSFSLSFFHLFQLLSLLFKSFSLISLISPDLILMLLECLLTILLIKADSLASPDRQLLLFSHDVRCGLIWLQRARKEEQMWSKLMSFGMGMSQWEDRWNKYFLRLVFLVALCCFPILDIFVSQRVNFFLDFLFSITLRGDMISSSSWSLWEPVDSISIFV